MRERPAPTSRSLLPASSPSALDGVVSLARLGHSNARIEDLLTGVAETAATTIGFRAAAINLYRPADDDFVVSTVVGSESAQRELIGTAVRGAWTRRIFVEAHEIERVYCVPAGAVDLEAYDARVLRIPDIGVSTDADAWQPADTLYAPLISSAGEMLGFLSLDEPHDALSVSRGDAGLRRRDRADPRVR